VISDGVDHVLAELRSWRASFEGLTPIAEQVRASDAAPSSSAWEADVEVGAARGHDRLFARHGGSGGGAGAAAAAGGRGDGDGGGEVTTSGITGSSLSSHNTAGPTATSTWTTTARRGVHNTSSTSSAPPTFERYVLTNPSMYRLPYEMTFPSLQLLFGSPQPHSPSCVQQRIRHAGVQTCT